MSSYLCRTSKGHRGGWFTSYSRRRDRHRSPSPDPGRSSGLESRYPGLSTRPYPLRDHGPGASPVCVCLNTELTTIGDVHRQIQSTSPTTKTLKGLLVLPSLRRPSPLLSPRRVGLHVEGGPGTSTLGVDVTRTVDIHRDGTVTELRGTGRKTDTPRRRRYLKTETHNLDLHLTVVKLGEEHIYFFRSEPLNKYHWVDQLSSHPETRV